MTKSEVIAAACLHVETNLQRTLAAAREIEAAATDAENRAEGKYDTRGVEASYLAAGQGQQVEELATALRLLQAPASFPQFDPGDAVGPGALIEVAMNDGERDFFLLAPAAGGLVLELAGGEVTLLAPGAPLRDKLDDRREGDSIAEPPMRIVAIS